MNKLTKVLLLASLAQTGNIWAWGERGHDSVTRIATRLLAEDERPDVAAFGRFLQKKEHMLGHLSNVPDIVWRSMGPEIDRLNSPSHFVDLDYVVSALPKSAEELPKSVADYRKAIEKNCKGKPKPLSCAPGDNIDAKFEKAGHAPFRVEALSLALRERFKALKALESQKGDEKKLGEDRTAVVNDILLYSGILSHFVGDLANPHHTSADYDGWHTGQGGLHSYFETEVLEVLPLEFEATVMDEAQRHKPAQSLMARFPGNPLAQAWELTLDSHKQLGELTRLDRDFSLLEKSVDAPKDGDKKREKAKRKAPLDVRQNFRNLLVLRTAAGADALARIWLEQWEIGGKPDLGFYRSYHYDVKPDFIPLGYAK